MSLNIILCTSFTKEIFNSTFPLQLMKFLIFCFLYFPLPIHQFSAVVKPQAALSNMDKLMLLYGA